MAEEKNIVHIPNFAYPFKKITDEKKCYEELLKDKAEGNYLFSQHGLWHGGLHFDSFFDKEIKCISDGEIVAYRINSKYLQSEGEENDENGLYSTGFVLIRHYFEYPKDNKLTFFSLYMHMADKSKYNEEKETTTTYTIKSGDSLSKIATQYKTTVAQIQKDNNISNANNISVGQKLQIKSKSTDTKPKYIIETPIYDSVQILAEPKSIKAGENIGLVGFYTPPRQKARIATHLEIFTKDDVKNFAKDAKKKYEEDKSPNKPKPTQIKVPIEKDIYKIEEQEIVKTSKANDTATLKDTCETQTEQEPLTNGTQIEVDESNLVCGSRYEVDSIAGKDVSEENLTIYKGSVGTIAIPKKTDKKTQEEKIYKLSDVKIIESNKIKYVQIDEETVFLYSDCEEIHPITFDWARIIDIQSKDKISIFDSLENHVVPTSVKNDVSLSDSFTELFKLIDEDNNNMIELLEIKEASKKELIKQTTSKYIVKHSSEWHKEINMADVFLDIFNKHKEEIKNSCEIDDHYKKQKERIDKLSFFEECKDIEEFPQSDEVYHINPIGVAGEFKTSKKGCLTKEIFDKIFPDAPENKRKEVLDLFNTYCHDFEINTPLRVAHFFAHVKAEVGKTLKGNVEDLTYKVSALKSLFGRYFNHYPNEADLYGYKGKISKTQYLSLSTLEKSKYTKSGSRYYTQVANQDEIAKRIYCCNSTDGYFLLKKGGDISGIEYKGKGFLQLTWKGNYKKVNDILKNKIPDSNIDIVNDPNSILNTKEGMLSAMGFWEWQKLNDKADNGDNDSVVDSITDKINFYTKSRQKRKNYFREIYSILKD